MAGWLAADLPMLVAELDGRVAGWARVSPYSDRCVYAGVGEYGVYVAASARGAGVGLALLDALCAEAEARGLHKLVGRMFATNAASRALAKAAGFREIGLEHRHGRIDGEWRDTVPVERLLGAAAESGVGSKLMFSLLRLPLILLELLLRGGAGALRDVLRLVSGSSADEPSARSPPEAEAEAAAGAAARREAERVAAAEARARRAAARPSAARRRTRPERPVAPAPEPPPEPHVSSEPDAGRLLRPRRHAPARRSRSSPVAQLRPAPRRRGDQAGARRRRGDARRRAPLRAHAQGPQERDRGR